MRACRSVTIAGRSTKLYRHVAEGFYSSRLKKYIAKLKRYILNVIPKRINGLGLGAIGVGRQLAQNGGLMGAELNVLQNTDFTGKKVHVRLNVK